MVAAAEAAVVIEVAEAVADTGVDFPEGEAIAAACPAAVAREGAFPEGVFPGAASLGGVASVADRPAQCLPVVHFRVRTQVPFAVQAAVDTVLLRDPSISHSVVLRDAPVIPQCVPVIPVPLLPVDRRILPEIPFRGDNVV
ncbi:MAG: hypothetical protein CME32_30960 [Gimesia sp.]|nr:hypothetical protein [Gimesia sp.]